MQSNPLASISLRQLKQAVAIREKICRPERIALIGNGIDLSTFDPALYPPERRREIRAGLGKAPPLQAAATRPADDAASETAG